MYIAIAGNIGSGKSLLAELLAEQTGWHLVSDTTENPYIDDFYDDMQRWAFPLQIYFFGMRLCMLDAALAVHKNVIVDRTVYEDAEVFARNLRAQALISGRDWQSFYELYSLAARKEPRPDILIYLRASADTLAKNIKKRGRPYEAGIKKTYLKQLGELYEDWTFGYSGNLLTIDIDEQDFIHNPDHRTAVLAQIQAAIKAL